MATEQVSEPTPPIAGILHVYDNSNRLVYFESSGASQLPLDRIAQNSLIFVGGLGDGLAAIPVLPRLSLDLARLGDWSLIQVLTRSSYGGWANGDIDRDVADLITLENNLLGKAGKTGRLVLFGHSTGCQDIVRLLQLHGQSTSYDAAILQAPVSDRQYAQLDMPSSALQETLKAAESQSEAGAGAYPLPRPILEIINKGKVDKDPVSADRWLSLVSKGGKEDYFSSDLNDEELNKAFAGLRDSKIPALILISGADECMPADVDKVELLHRLVKAASGDSESIFGHIVAGASHSVESESARASLSSSILRFLEAKVC